ncbi:MAG: trypsin-like serine protease [Candidatus Limnocylindrales bacterium]
MRKAIVAWLAAVLLVASTAPVVAITYGEKTGPDYGNVGSMVLKIEGQYYQACTGTLIRHGVFLTAAHCLVGIPDDWGVYVTFRPDLEGAKDADMIPIVGEPVWHPSFGKDMANLYDLGALRFDVDASKGIPLATVAPVDYLSTMDKRDRRNGTYTAVGYGTIRVSRKTGPQGILDNTARRYGTQSFRSLQKAWLTLAMNETTGDSGTCYGDSGGPHFLNGLIVSLTVTGDAMCKATDKTYRVDRAWVHEWLKAEKLLPGT